MMTSQSLFSVVELSLGESDLSVSHFTSSPLGPINEKYKRYFTSW